MGSEHIKFMNLLKGKRIKLTLKSASFSGVVQRINPDKTIYLSDVSDGNGCKAPGAMLFFGRDILNVEFFDTTPDNGDHQQSVKLPQELSKTSALDADDEKINFEVIDEFLLKFFPAVLHIKSQSVIGVCAEGVELHRNGKLCWLLIATKTKVYFFDILQLGNRMFKNGLSAILESKHILKVIHDCRSISGCLISQFGVKLTNVFDTQVADVLCFRSETGGFLPDRLSTLEELLRLRLKVPASQLSAIQTKSQLTEKEQQVWLARPCPAALMRPMVLSVSHLMPLRLHLMDTLMADYLLLVDCYLNSSHYLPDEVEDVSRESMLKLPRELKQLDQILSERHRFAAEQHAVTESGLLARLSAPPQSPSEKSPSAEDQNGMRPQPEPEPEPEPKPEEPPSSHDDRHLRPKEATVSPEETSEAPVRDGGSDWNIQERAGSSHGEFLNPGTARSEESSAPAFPFLGRGVFLCRPPPQVGPRQHLQL